MDMVGYLKERWDIFHARMNEIKPKNDRSFGHLMGAACLAICLWVVFHGEVSNAVPWGITAIVFLLLSELKPAHLRPLNILWLFIGFVLETLINPLIMGLIFFVAVTPFALAFRLSGRDELGLRKDKDCESYWDERDFTPSADDFKKQF